MHVPALPGEVEQTASREFHAQAHAGGNFNNLPGSLRLDIVDLQQLAGMKAADLAAVAQDAQVLPVRAGVDGGRQHGVLPPGGGYDGHALPGRR